VYFLEEVGTRLQLLLLMFTLDTLDIVLHGMPEGGQRRSALDRGSIGEGCLREAVEV
jgi:hypothetical protein